MRSVLRVTVILTVLLSAFVAGAQIVAPISGQVINQFGQPLPNASIRVCSVTSTGNPCTPTTPIYFDYNLTIQAPNPYSADQFGNYTVYVPAIADPNLYEVQVFPSTGITWSYVVKGPVIGSSGVGTVQSFSSGDLPPLFTTSVTSPTANPVQSFTLSNAANLTFLGNVSGSTGPPSYISFVAGTGIVFTPSGGNTLTVSSNFIGLTLQHNGTPLASQTLLNFNDTTPAPPGGNTNVIFQTDGTGKISAYVPTAGPSGACGPTADDDESTDCGNGNFVGSTPLTEGQTVSQAYGFQNVNNSPFISLSVALGFNNLNNNVGSDFSGNSVTVVVGIGESNGSNLRSGEAIIGIGQNSGNGNPAGGSTDIFDIVAIGDDAASQMGNDVDDIIAIGNAPIKTLPTNSADIIAIGDGADKQCSFFTGCVSIPNPVATVDVIAIGDVAGSFNAGDDVIAIGHQALGSNTAGAAVGVYNQADFIIAIGTKSLVANTTGTRNIGIGGFAGSDGYAGGTSFGNSNKTGSDNVWVGYDSGPNTTTQLSNTIALGNNAHNTQSNQLVLGNASITQLIIFGSGDGCLESTSGIITGSGVPCGSGSGGSAWSALTGGTNNAMTSICDTGCSITPANSGIIAATSVGGIVVTGTPAIGNALIATSTSAATWMAASTGTVTSVALTLPGIFTVSGSPITSAGTFSVTLATETANTVWAGPVSGGAATPTFRALVAADLPLGSASAFGALKCGSGTTCSAGTLTVTAGAVTSLTTSGTSGAATLISGVLNIPVYTSGGFANPMTTLGDIIRGGASGTPGRLAIGTTGQILTVVGGVPAWAAAAFVNPMTTAGDIITGGASGVAQRLAGGTNGFVLTMVSGAPAWAAAGAGAGTVTSFAAPSVSWPVWLVPTVTNSTTTPSLTVSASPIPYTALTSLSANQVLLSLTATTPSGFTMPSCSGATNALTWVSGTGFGCNSAVGTTVASPKFQIPYYSAAGTASTLTGDPNFVTDGAGNITVASIGLSSTLQGFDLLGVGSGTITLPGTAPANYAGWIGPPTGTPTYVAYLPNVNPSVAGIMVLNPATTVNGIQQASVSTINPTFVAQTDAATVTWAIGGAMLANATLTFTVHGGSRTLNLTGLVNGGSYVIWLKQDGTGGEGLTLGTGCTWKVSGGGSGAITPSTGANAVDILAFTYDGTNCYANFNKNFN